LERLHRHGPGYRPGPQAEAPRRIVVRNYYRDAAGRLRRRTAEADEGGLPPSSSAIVSPYDTTARYVRHGHIIRWKGFAAHVTETCATGSDRVWPFTYDGQQHAVDRTLDPAAWEEAVRGNTALVTQWDDGRHTGSAPGLVASSSASMPSAVADMLLDLDVRGGERVLDIGTGTGTRPLSWPPAAAR
jgi:hypothetical protein